MFQQVREVKCTTSAPGKLVLFMHGVGSDCDDLISLASYFQPILSDAVFLSPNGIEQYDVAPFGYQWFSLSDRSPAKMQASMEQNHKLINQSIEHELTRRGLQWEDLILIGFSQGVAAALYTLMTVGRRLHAAIGFSGFLIPPVVKNITKQAQETPVCLIHGINDDVLPVAALTKSAGALSNYGFDVKTCIIPELQHSIDNHGLTFAINFLQDIQHMQS